MYRMVHTIYAWENNKKLLIEIKMPSFQTKLIFVIESQIT